MTIYTDNYTAKISINEVSFTEMYGLHREYYFEEVEEHYEEMTIEYFSDEECRYYE